MVKVRQSVASPWKFDRLGTTPTVRRLIPTALGLGAALAAAGCLGPIPDFDPTLSDATVLGAIRVADIDLFCQEQATYVVGYADRAVHDRARCLVDVVIHREAPEAIDRASCEAAVDDCVDSGPRWAFAYSCELPTFDDALGATETVGERAACVTESVRSAWPLLSAELDCSMLGDGDAIDHLLGRAYPTGACRKHPL